jgi:hypothetical protein
MKTLAKLLFSFIILIFAAVCGEIFLRIWWTDSPENYLSVQKYPYNFNIQNKNLLYKHTENWKGYATGIKVNINELGLRDISEKRYCDKNLILYIGDSLFFGYGVKNKYTISNWMNLKFSKFDGWHHLNCGVCGYNYLQNLENLKLIYSNYKNNIKYVFVGFIHNDLNELYKPKNIKGSLPKIESAYFYPPKRDGILYKIYNLILPDDLLNHRFIHKISLRKIFLRYSKLYLFVALKFKQYIYSLGTSEKKYFYLFPQLKISDEIIYKPLNELSKKYKDFLKKNNLNYSVIILLDSVIKGNSILKIQNIFEKNNLNFYNIAIFLPESKEYYKNFTLGWDSHPNSKGTALFAQKLSQILNNENIIISTKSKFNNLYKKKLSEYNALQKKISSIQFNSFLEHIYTKQKKIYFENIDEIDKHIIYGNFNSFPVKKNKTEVKLHGVWLSKLGSICLAVDSPLKNIILNFDNFYDSDSMSFYINGKETDYAVTTKNKLNYQITINVKKNEKIINNKFFYELFFDFDNYFNDDDDKIFSYFLKNMDLDF